MNALENKVIAVDASIWLYHFLKAMRDENGNMIKGAHVLGFFRRICKLLYLKIKPVFVFDGPPPALKRQTLMLRAQQQASEERHRRKVVEKLLRNQIKMHVLAATSELNMDGDTEISTAGNVTTPVVSSIEEDGAQDADDVDIEDVEDEESSVEDAPAQGPSAGSRQWQRWRRHRREHVPQPFRGFMAKRRGVSEVVLPELPDEPLRDILQVPRRRTVGRMREPDEWKGYVLPGGGMVTIPLDGPVALEDFEVLDPKTKYNLLKRAQDIWYQETRMKAVAAKDDAGAFVNVQLETFLRHIRTNKEIEKAKMAMAEESGQNVGHGIVEGDVYSPPSWLRSAESGATQSSSIQSPANGVTGPTSSSSSTAGAKKRIRQLDGQDMLPMPALDCSENPEFEKCLDGAVSVQNTQDVPAKLQSQSDPLPRPSVPQEQTAEDLFGWETPRRGYRE
jgi:DNA excision repair protein ERCC-5